MKVLKFGGSSVGSTESIIRVVDIISDALQTDKCVVVFSAMRGVTDKLIEGGRLAESGDESFRGIVKDLEQLHLDTIRKLIPVTAQSSILSQTMRRLNDVEALYESVANLRELSPRSLDQVLSHGELLISQIIAAKFASLGVAAVWKDSRELIKTDSRFGSAAVDFEKTNRCISEYFATTAANIFILPGFIGSNDRGVTTTLGRGGGDYSGAIIAAGLNVDRLEIWTDVSGMMTADPRLVRNARQIPSITYHEAMELSHFGAKVIYPPTLQPTREKGIAVVVKNTFEPDAEGTTISAEGSTNGAIRGISSVNDICILSLEGSGMVGVPGYSKRLFGVLSQNGINVVLITQASSEHSICVGIQAAAAELAKQAIDHEFEHEIATGRLEPVVVEQEVSIVAVVGDRMRHHTGISGKMFSSLGSQGVNIRAIAQGSSERNISAVIATSDVRKAVNVLHEEFFSDGKRQINLFIAGVGLVGSAFLRQIATQKEHLANDLNLDVRIVGLSNSKQIMVTDPATDGEATLDRLLSQDIVADSASSFAERVVSSNLRNSVFIDMTASPAVAGVYERLLAKSIAVVACNKIASSSEYANYRNLKDLAREFNASFLFEANVGAGLPVIKTLNDLIASGDKIERIEGVLSGSLNYIFSGYDGSTPFASIVRDAQAKGYTEPDPRLDLSGADVARKILILARESGFKSESADIKVNGFLPEACLNGDVDAFFFELERNEDHFKRLFNEAAEKDESVRFAAMFDTKTFEVGVRQVARNHDFAQLTGTENAIAFHTTRYSDRPLVIKGAGAGAEVTAAGVFADVIRAAS